MLVDLLRFLVRFYARHVLANFVNQLLQDGHRHLDAQALLFIYISITLSNLIAGLFVVVQVAIENFNKQLNLNG